MSETPGIWFLLRERGMTSSFPFCVLRTLRGTPPQRPQGQGVTVLGPGARLRGWGGWGCASQAPSFFSPKEILSLGIIDHVTGNQEPVFRCGWREAQGHSARVGALADPLRCELPPPRYPAVFPSTMPRTSQDQKACKMNAGLWSSQAAHMHVRVNERVCSLASLRRVNISQRVWPPQSSPVEQDRQRVTAWVPGWFQRTEELAVTAELGEAPSAPRILLVSGDSGSEAGLQSPGPGSEA